MSLPASKTDGYVLHPDGGEAHPSFVGGGSFVIKATAEQTGGKLLPSSSGVRKASDRPSMCTATTTNSS